jgi:hypothetical protein
LSKKMKIITHFYRELKARNAEVLGSLRGREGQLSTYVVAHFSTSHYALFWLSTAAFHAKFKDQTEIMAEHDHFTYLGRDRRETVVKNDRLSTASEEVRYKYNHLAALIKKIKRNKFSMEERGEGEREREREEERRERDRASREKAS